MKKIMAGVLSACIAISPIAGTSFAKATEPVSISAEETEAKSMERVLRIVKSKIEVPKELDVFSYRINYNSGNNSDDKYWNFEWMDKERNNTINVRANNSGNILSYSIYNGNKNNFKPTYLKEELIETAVSFIEKVAPEISKNIELKSSEFSGVYSGTYLYTFERIENGIRMPDDRVTVSVNYETKEVKNFNSNWTFGVEIPSSDVSITIEEAREKIGKEVVMNLRYMSKTEEIDGKEIVKAYLVYVPDKSYMAVDAKTGAIYDTRDEYYDMGALNSANKEMAESDMVFGANGVNEELTAEELNKIREMENLISKEEAILKVTSKSDILLLEDTAKAVDARLTQKYNYSENKNEGYIWRITFSDPRAVNYDSGDTYRAYTNVSVDANDGKILSFNSSVRNYYDSKSKEWENVKVKYSSKECQEVFEKFVKELEKEKFDNTKLSNFSDTAYLLKYVNEEPVYGGYSYNYSRMNEGVEYSYDRITGKVDGVTGKIYSYNVNWTDSIEFESPKNAMSQEEAYKAYSEKEGFELVYEINNKHYIENDIKQEEYYDYSDLYVLRKEARLVYRTNINPSYISPFTGEQLNYSGDIYEDINEKEYTDIANFWGERNIKLITDMGYTFSGDKFLPEEIITKEEWFNLLQVVRSYTNEKEYENLDKVTKLDAIKIIIKNLGLENVAKLYNIYKASFNDIEEISIEDIGYVALAEGLKIVNGDKNGRFNPNKELSRIEAVCLVLNLANVE